MPEFPVPVTPTTGVPYTVGLSRSGFAILLANDARGIPTHPVLLEKGAILEFHSIPVHLQEMHTLSSTHQGQLTADKHRWSVIFDNVGSIPLSNFLDHGGVEVFVVVR